MHREARIANYLLAGFVTLSVVFLLLPLSGPVESAKAAASYIFIPVAETGARAVNRFAEAPAGIRRLIAADMHNRILLNENRQAVLLKAEAESLRLENLRLRKALGLKGRPRRAALWARVMERDALHWYHGFMVDAGKDMGVEVNAPVLARREDDLVLVGRVTRVGAASSQVLFITDELSSVAAYVGEPRFEGLIQGRGAKGLWMKFLPADSKVQEGVAVFTSPTSTTFPPDVLIGAVTRASPQDAFLTFPSVEVLPASEGASLSEVMILKSRAPDPIPEEESEEEPP